MTQRSKRIVSDASKEPLILDENKMMLKKYEIDMKLRELSEKTIYQYSQDLKQWLIYVVEEQNNKSVLNISEDDLTEFFYYCKSEGNNSRRMRRRMASISAFYKYLRKKRLIIENPCEFIDRPKRDADVLTQTFMTQEQVFLMKYRLKEMVDAGKRNAKNLQLYALFSLSTMARVNAVSSIRWEQVNYAERTCNDVLEKEGKIVTLYFNEEVKELLFTMHHERQMNGVDDGGYVFGRNGKAIGADTLTDWAHKVGALGSC